MDQLGLYIWFQWWECNIKTNITETDWRCEFDSSGL